MSYVWHDLCRKKQLVEPLEMRRLPSMEETLHQLEYIKYCAQWDVCQLVSFCVNQHVCRICLISGGKFLDLTSLDSDTSLKRNHTNLSMNAALLSMGHDCPIYANKRWSTMAEAINRKPRMRTCHGITVIPQIPVWKIGNHTHTQHQHPTLNPPKFATSLPKPSTAPQFLHCLRFCFRRSRGSCWSKDLQSTLRLSQLRSYVWLVEGMLRDISKETSISPEKNRYLPIFPNCENVETKKHFPNSCVHSFNSPWLYSSCWLQVSLPPVWKHLAMAQNEATTLGR